MGMSTNQGGGRATLSEINVTPLVDVMLVLLIIFMVAAPMIEQGVDLDLPNTETVEMAPAQDKNVVKITKDEKVYLGDTYIPDEELLDKISNNRKLQQDEVVYFYADETIPYRKVAQVLAILRKAGVKNLGMVTDPIEMPGPASPKDDKKDKDNKGKAKEGNK